MQNIKKLQSGQGIIELIVGISLVSIALISSILLTTRSIQNTDVSRKQQQALALAKKNSEMIRKMRTDMLWDDFVDSNFENILSNSSSDYYVELPTGFTRNVNINDITGDTTGGKEVTVFIIWSDVKGDHTVDLATNFYN